METFEKHLLKVSDKRLLELKEITEWQISIAKCPKIVEIRKEQLEKINQRIEFLKTIKK